MKNIVFNCYIFNVALPGMIRYGKGGIIKKTTIKTKQLVISN